MNIQGFVANLATPCDNAGDLKDKSMISFRGAHYTKEAILYAVYFYVRYGVSYRDLEKILEERGVQVDHSTLNRWVIQYSPNRVVIDKSGANEAGLLNMNILLFLVGWVYLIEILQVKYLNNRIEQDHPKANQTDTRIQGVLFSSGDLGRY